MKLFYISNDKKVSLCILRLLIDSYIRQEARVIWNECEFNYFRLSNGVAQGRVLSPSLFNLYIDRLLCKLLKLGYGCHSNHVYMGALSYADDITISCPSIYG